MKIFIIVRVIRHRGFRGDDDEGDAERPCEIIRLAVTIIDRSESHRGKDISQSNCNKIKKAKFVKKKKPTMKLSYNTHRFVPAVDIKNFVKKGKKKKKENLRAR